MFKQIEKWIAKQIYKALNKQTPVVLGDIVRHNMTGFDGHVIALQYQGWFRPVCRLTVRNVVTNRFISNIDRNEFTHAAQLRLIDLSGAIKNSARSL